jgi:photoactive yellow protein
VPVNTVEQQLLVMSEAQIDAFPIGILRLDRSGNILSYNKAQAEFARRTAETTVGLNFFRDVAPCTAVKAFQGRFYEAINSVGGSLIERFKFEFRFEWGVKEVTIGMVRRVSRDGFNTQESIYVVVYASPVQEEWRSG